MLIILLFFGYLTFLHTLIYTRSKWELEAGIPAKSPYNLLKDFGLSRTAISSNIERASKVMLADSYKIWLGRERG